MKRLIKILCIVMSLSLVICFLTCCKNRSRYIEIEKEYNEKKKNALSEAEILKEQYFIDEAIERLSRDKVLKEDSDVQDKINEYKDYKDSLVRYTGTVQHIFFHSLIVYPELAFDNTGHSANGYNMWFVTVDEFKKMLPELKNRGYVLVKITDVYKRDKKGKVVRPDIYLPKGKKPLIISQDDVNYYNYMKTDGFADRLLVDKNGEVSTLVRNKDDEEEITRDGDLIPILDDFVKKNPDFSYKGAKGTIAVTGYEGVLGYRLDSEENEEEAKKTADVLKENGWTFASHSYTHNGDGYFQGTQNYNNLKSDFTKWNEEIRPIVGDTNIFISPFGAVLEGDNINLVKENGFEIYCNVCRLPENEYFGNLVMTPRYDIDGYTLIHCKDELNKLFFNPDEVMTPNVRPSLKVED